MGQNDKKPRCNRLSTGSIAHSFARTAHSFTCSALLASLTRSAVLTHLLACSLRSLQSSWQSEWLNGYFFWFFSILDQSVKLFFTFIVQKSDFSEMTDGPTGSSKGGKGGQSVLQYLANDRVEETGFRISFISCKKSSALILQCH